jgi:hypothetical protein
MWSETEVLGTYSAYHSVTPVQELSAPAVVVDTPFFQEFVSKQK